MYYYPTKIAAISFSVPCTRSVCLDECCFRHKIAPTHEKPRYVYLDFFYCYSSLTFGRGASRLERGLVDAVLLLKVVLVWALRSNVDNNPMLQLATISTGLGERRRNFEFRVFEQRGIRTAEQELAI